MKAIIRLKGMKVEAEVDSEDPSIGEACQRIVDNCGERIEAAVAHAVMGELKCILPNITVECTGVWDEGEEDVQRK